MDQSRENIIEDSQDEIDIGELLRYLKTKWIVLVAVFLIGVIGAGVGTKCLLTPRYTAVSKLYVVSASGKNIVNLDDLRLGTTLSSDYTELLKTRPICNEIISDLGLDYTVSQLKNMISIVPIEDTRLLTVSVVSADPEEAKNIANALADKAVTYLPKLMGISAPNIAEEAITPTVPTSPSTKKNVALGGILALALIVGIYTVRFLMDDTVKTAEDVEKIIGVMPLTVILEYQDKDKKKKGRHRRKQVMNKVQINNMPTLTYSTEEAINRLRVNLNFQAKDVKKIMVISSTENEGKSFVAFHTWKQMAESGIHTLLLDTDLRKSVMAEKYQMEAENGKKLIGTSHVLSKDMPLKDAVWHTIMPQGDILPNVENLVNPAMLLESETFHRLLDEASEEYRYIFIDAPPLDLVSDGEKIGSLCDGAILVVASGKVSRGMVQNSIHQLERAGCPLLGIVLNRVEDQRKKNYYQKYGYYASEKGKKK